MGHTIVIVDDDEGAARALARLMDTLDYTVLGMARDADAGVALIREQRPDVALVDVQLGAGRSGLEVAVELAGEATPLVFVTAFDEPPLAQLAGLDGVYGFVNKPVGRAALRGTIELVRMQHESRTRLIESEARAKSAVAASRAKTEFLAHMSHELRTPLNAVLGLSEALIERVFGPLSDAQAAALSTIHSSGRHLLELINDVLDIARVEAGSLPIETEQVMLRPLIDETSALMEPQVVAKGQRLTVELARTLPPVDVDRRRIKQVLLNLLGNASKFSPAGALITLSIAVDDAARRVRLAVSDTGPGIAPADRDRVFEPFVTLDPSLSRTHGGAGLGLPLAKRIVDLHRGQIRLDSEVGRGSTFTVELPISASYAVDAIGERDRTFDAHRDALLGSGRTVLLAEDNDATVLSVRAYLESHGYHVRVVRDGIAALGAASDPDVAVVLMDLQMPGMDGLEVTRRLRARAATAPIVALTAHAMPGDEQRCLAAGASAYMAKPVRLAALVDTIGRLLENRR